MRSYLARLGLGGAEKRMGPSRAPDTPAMLAPTVESLKRLHLRHLQRVPFENLDIHRGIPIILEEEHILSKIVERGRGGFCYELNTAFAWLLRKLGYSVRLLAAEVARNEGGFGIPFDHMTLLVEPEKENGSYLADVGFGDSFLFPLPLRVGEAEMPSGDRYRLRQQELWWNVDRRSKGASAFEPQYRFTLVPRRLHDFIAGCHYHQTSPHSTFTRGPVCSIALADGRLTLSCDKLVAIRNGIRTETPIPSREEWTRALKQHFGVEL
ncbi:MAG: arylamine N-acetyltransferase [Acidobacteriota bacterium]